MAMKLEIKKATNRENVIVMGAPLSGKTWWVASQVKGKHMVISTDGNAKEGSNVARVNNWDDLLEAVDFVLARDDIEEVSLDLLDDAYAYSEARAMKKLGMSYKADAKGSYGKLGQTVDELLRERALRPLLMSDKKVYIVMHTNENKEGEEQPCFGSFSVDALKTLNWLKGRAGKVVLCTQYAGMYEATVIAERSSTQPQESKPEKADDKKSTAKAEDEKSEEQATEKE